MVASVAAPVRGTTREQRARLPLARSVAVEAAVEFGVCIRPVAVRRTDVRTGETVVVDVPCGSTLASACPPCADRSRRLRAQQCREGWHMEAEPELTPDRSTAGQRDLVVERADVTAALVTAQETGNLGVAAATVEVLSEIDADIAAAGMRGSVDPDRPSRRVRSTRRRGDAPDLPARPSNGSTLGRVFTDDRTGKRFRPSLFLTVTLPSYGRVRPGESTPVDPAGYDYPRAARDAVHFGKLLDRLVQNLRRVAGYDLQYFAVVEPQRRLAPHAHFAIRGTLPRALVRQVVAATYHQVWWPATDEVVYAGDRLPVWDPAADEGAGGYRDPETGQVLPTWGEAVDAIGADADPEHVVRFGSQVDVKGVLAGSPEAEKAIGYLVKYLTKTLGDPLDPDPDPVTDGDGNQLASVTDSDRRARGAAHRDRLLEELRWQPCSPACPNWLRYGVQPRNPREGMRPGSCRGKAHRPTHLGYAGRRVLVSRKWTGKTLTDHRADRRAFVLQALGVDPATETDTGGRYLWELARPTDPDVAPLSRRLLLALAERERWRAAYRAARDAIPPGNSATVRRGRRDGSGDARWPR